MMLVNESWVSTDNVIGLDDCDLLRARQRWGGAALGGSVPSVNVTIF